MLNVRECALVGICNDSSHEKSPLSAVQRKRWFLSGLHLCSVPVPAGGDIKSYPRGSTPGCSPRMLCYQLVVWFAHDRVLEPVAASTCFLDHGFYLGVH